jgi:prohibitin 1
LIAKSFQKYGNGLLQLRRIEASKEIAQSLSQSRNVTYLPSDGSNMLLNLGNQ